MLVNLQVSYLNQFDSGLRPDSRLTRKGFLFYLEMPRTNENLKTRIGVGDLHGRYNGIKAHKKIKSI